MSFLKKIGSWFLDIDNQLDEAVKNILDTRFNNISEKLDAVQTTVNSNNQCVKKIESEISNDIQNKVGSLKDEISNCFGTVDSGLKDLQEKVDKLTDEQAVKIEDLSKEIDKVKEALNDKIAEVKKLKTNVADKDKQIEEFEDKLKSIEITSSQKEGELNKKLTKAQEALEAECKKSADAENALQSWRDAVACYKKVRDAMKNCETFQNVLKDRNLTDDSEIGLLAFVQELGKTMDFLKYIHDTARDAKKSTKKLMSDDELAVYRALNKCYRHIWNINFDVFCTPGKSNDRKPVGEKFEKIPFNKDEAIYLNDEKNKNMKNITGIYVPLLLNRENNVSKNAYVEANNL